MKFAQEEFAQDNGVSFKKTITFVNGRKATTESDLGILPATSTTAGVMSAADKVKLDAVDGRIQGVKIERLETDKIQISEEGGYHSYGTSVIGKSLNIGHGVTIADGFTVGKYVSIGRNTYISDVTIRGGLESYNGVILGTNSIGTNLIGINQTFNAKIAIGTGVHIAKGVGIAIDDDGILNWGREIQGSYQMKTAATTDDLSALATRVSALEDLLKLA